MKDPGTIASIIAGGLTVVTIFCIVFRRKRTDKPATATPEPKQEKHAEYFNELIRLIAEDEDQNPRWKLMKKMPNISIYKMLSDNSAIAIIKARAIITDASPSKVFQAIWDGEVRKKWDTVLKRFEILEKIDETTDLIRFYAESPLPSLVSNREFVQMRCCRDTERGKVIVYWSVDKPEIPVPEGVVRANTIISGYIIERDESNPNNTRLDFISQNDVRGSIPPQLINTFAPRKASDWIKKLMSACKTLSS